MKGKIMKTTNLSGVLGSPINTVIHTFEKVDTIREVRIRRICSIHVTYYTNGNLCKVEFTGKLHTPSARMMYIPTDQLGMVMTSMTDNYWKRIYTDHIRYDVDGCICIPIDNIIGLINDAEYSIINELSSVTPQDRVCDYLENRKRF